MPVQEWDQECAACHGTGLYVGMGERNGMAVVCHACKGTGQTHQRHEYNEFTGRNKPPEEVKRVLAANPGIMTAAEERFGGVPISEWLVNPKSVQQRGKEMRQFTCPAWWYQSADYTKKPQWDDAERKCGWGMFSECRHFADKAGCWTKFDKEQEASYAARNPTG